MSKTIPMGKTRLTGYPSRAVPSTAGGSFLSFTALSNNKNNTTRALILRPAQCFFCEAGAVGLADCMNSSSRFIQSKIERLDSSDSLDRLTSGPTYLSNEGQRNRHGQYFFFQ